MIVRIARRELIEWARDERLRWLAGLCLLLMMSLTLMGWQSTQSEIRLRETAVAGDLENFLEQGRKNPHAAAHFGQYAFRPTLLPAAIDPGVSAWMGTMIWLEAHRRNLPEFRPADEGTVDGPASVLSVSWVLQYLLPLLLIVGGFATVAGERERGTLALLMAQGVPLRTLLAGKSLAIAGAVSALLSPLIVALICLYLLAPDFVDMHGSGVRLTGMALLYLLYALGFIGLVLCVSLAAATARIALLTLLVLWVGLVVFVPRFAADAAAAAHPLPMASEFWSAIKRGEGAEVSSDVPQERAARLRASLAAELLEQYNVERVEDLPVNFTAVYLQRLEEADAPIFDHAYGELWKKQEQQRAVRSRFGMLSPAVSLREVSMGLAGTDPFALSHFSQAAEAHRRTLVSELNGIQAREGAGPGFYVAEADTWQKIQRFRYTPPSAKDVIRRHRLDIALLFVWAFVPLGLAMLLAGRARPIR
jgi:ABC-2 type transport system permease protein